MPGLCKDALHESQEGILAYLSLVRSVGGREIGQPASVRLGAA
jgi:hypothetical protein